MKNINLRVDREWKVVVSANKYVPLKLIDEFVLSKKDRIEKAVLKMRERIIPEVTADEEHLKKFFSEISCFAYELFKDEIDFKPAIKIKSMKSAWGICHPKKKYITFNKLLYIKPKAAAEYVAVHEYTHFLYPNHQKEFYGKIAEILPDYKEREKLLKE